LNSSSETNFDVSENNRVEEFCEQAISTMRHNGNPQLEACGGSSFQFDEKSTRGFIEMRPLHEK